MQTFHTNVDFTVTARELDTKRLGKQRIEVLQIVKALSTGQGWVHHPATKMWKGHEGYLIKYGFAMINEFKARGHNDTGVIGEQLNGYALFYEDIVSMSPPDWWGDELVMLSHQSNLLRKSPEHYVYEVVGNMPYFWPQLTDDGYNLVLSGPDRKRVKVGLRTVPASLEGRYS